MFHYEKRQHHKSEKPQIARDFHQGLVHQVSQDFDKKLFNKLKTFFKSHRKKIQAFYQLLQSIGSKLKQSVFKHLALQWSYNNPVFLKKHLPAFS